MSPTARVRFSWVLLIGSLIGWAASHVLLIVTHPPDASSWVFHLLLALSWFAITIGAVEALFTADVRREQDDDE